MSNSLFKIRLNILLCLIGDWLSADDTSRERINPSSSSRSNQDCSRRQLLQYRPSFEKEMRFDEFNHNHLLKKIVLTGISNITMFQALQAPLFCSRTILIIVDTPMLARGINSGCCLSCNNLCMVHVLN